MSIATVGDKVRKQCPLVRDLTDALVNTPTVTLAVTKPDGTAVSPAPTVTNSGAGGVYTADFTVDAAGIWELIWTASGTVTATYYDQVDVEASGRATVVDLADLKAHLRLTGTADRDDQLREVILAVTDTLEPAVGLVEPTTVTEYHQLDGALIVPSRRPLISVTSVTPDQSSTALASTDYVADTRKSFIRMRVWLTGLYSVVYRAGHNPWPAGLKYASLLVCQHEWQVRNGNGGRPSPDMDALAMLPGSGFLVPMRALELMKPHLRRLKARS